MTMSANGTGREYVLDQYLRATVLTRGSETDGAFDVVRGTAKPGMATALHRHTGYEERLWVIDGSATVWAGRAKTVIRPGDFCTVPRNVPHMIEAGPDGVDMLNISSPAAFAALMERTATPAHLAGPDTDLDLELFLRVSQELGDVVLGPPGTVPGDAATAADQPLDGIHGGPDPR